MREITGRREVKKLIVLSYALIDGEFHESEKKYLQENKAFELNANDEKKLLKRLNNSDKAFNAFKEAVNNFPDSTEDREEVILSLIDIAWADGVLHDKEKEAFQFLKEKWEVNINLDASGWKPTNEQKEIIEYDSEGWLRVEAKPGAGKTATACARIVNLIEEKGLSPNSIWLMSFTRTAIKELNDRIDNLSDFNSEDGFGSLPLAGIKLSTIDSRAGKIRYGFSSKESAALFGGFDKNISEASDILDQAKNDDEVKYFFEGINHLILDEAQDISGDRATFIFSLLNLLHQKCGVTIFEDPAQALYDNDWSTKKHNEKSKIIKSKDFKNRPYLKLNIHELNSLHSNNIGNKKIQENIYHELTFRKTKKAKILKNELEKLKDIKTSKDNPKLDSIQNIRLSELIDKSELVNKIKLKKLSKIHRTGNKGLLEFIDNFHELAGYKVTCSEDEYRKMHYKVEDIATRNVGEFEPKSIKDLENEFSNSLVLFRERGEVLVNSYKASVEGKFHHRIRMGHREAPINPWLGILFYDWFESTISKEEFMELWEQKLKRFHHFLSLNDREQSWINLFKKAPLKKKYLDIKVLRNILSKESVDPKFCNPDQGLWGPIFGTIHGSKGREADNVALYINASIPEDNNLRHQEARVLYVAATRSRSHLHLGTSSRKFYQRMDSGRVFSKSKNNLRMEVGFPGDYDKKSLVNKNNYSEQDSILIQETLLNIVNPSKTPVNLKLFRLSKDSNYNYELQLANDNEIKGMDEIGNSIGRMNNNEFKNDIFFASNILGRRGSPKSLNSLQLIGLGTGVISQNDERLSFINTPFNKSGFWLYPVFSGFPFLNFYRN